MRAIIVKETIVRIEKKKQGRSIAFFLFILPHIYYYFFISISCVFNSIVPIIEIVYSTSPFVFIS
jgi:hypothetical protein